MIVQFVFIAPVASKLVQPTRGPFLKSPDNFSGWGPFLESPDNFSGPESIFYELKVYLKDLNFVGF